MSELQKRIRKTSLHSGITSAGDTTAASLRRNAPGPSFTSCVCLDYKPLMQEYYERAKRECCAANMGHEPHTLFKVFKMQQNLVENGTMKVANWN